VFTLKFTQCTVHFGIFEYIFAVCQEVAGEVVSQTQCGVDGTIIGLFSLGVVVNNIRSPCIHIVGGCQFVTTSLLFVVKNTVVFNFGVAVRGTQVEAFQGIGGTQTPIFLALKRIGDSLIELFLLQTGNQRQTERGFVAQLGSEATIQVACQLNNTVLITSLNTVSS